MSCLNRNLLLKDIVVECAPKDAGNPVLDALALVILDIEQGRLDLERISETKWIHDGAVAIPFDQKLEIVAQSTIAGDMGCITFTKDDWEDIRDNSHLKLDFEMEEPSLSLSLHLPELSALEPMSASASATTGSPTVLHASGLSIGDVDNADELNSQGHKFLQAFETTGDEEDISRAIQSYKQAAACLSTDDARLGIFLRDICAAHLDRYQNFGGTHDLQEVITTGQKAIAKTAEEHFVFPELLNILGTSFFLRFQRTGDWEDLTEAIESQRRAAQLIPERDDGLPGLLGNLGYSLFRRFEYRGDLDDISEAIRNQQLAVQLTPEGNTELPTYLNNLGLSLLRRFERSGNMDDLSEAIENQGHAVQLTPDGNAILPTLFSNLGNSYLRRFERNGDLTDITEAIENQQCAIQLSPDEHPDLPTYLSNLGLSFSSRFEQSGNPDDISRAVEKQQLAVQLLPDATFLNNLGISLLGRFECHGDLDDVSQAIGNQQRAIQLTSVGHANLPGWLSNLGLAFSRRFERSGDLDDISEAIKTQQRSIQLAPDGHANLPIWLTNLGLSFMRRFERSGDMDDVSQAIENQRHAVQLAPDGHAILPTLFNNLGNSCLRRFERSGDLDDISEAIKNQQRAVQLTVDEHASLPIWLNNLGLSFLRRFERDGILHDISEAIKHQRHAVQLTADGHPDLTIWLNNLGLSYLRRFERTGDLPDITDAIENQRRAVQLSPDGHSSLPTYLSNLGLSYLRRFEREGDLDDISDAIKNQQHAVQLAQDGHASLPMWLNNLGLCFIRRFERDWDPSDISEAIKTHQRAVQLTPDGHPNLPTCLNNLGLCFLHRFEQEEDMQDISEAIKNHQHAVRLTPDGHAELALWVGNLGNAFLRRFEHGGGGDVDDISEAIKNQRRAVQLRPEGHANLPTLLNNLGTSLLIYFEHNANLDYLAEAIKCQELAIQLMPDGHANLPLSLGNLGDALVHRFEHSGNPEFLAKALSNYRLSATSATGPPTLRLQVAQRWASCLRRSSPPSSQLLEAHACIIQLVSVVSGLGITVQRRHQALVNSSSLSLAASAAALSLGRPDKALEWLVEGRCIVWNQINQLRTPLDQLRAHDKDLADRFSAISRELENAGSRSEFRRKEEALSMDDKISLEEQAGNHIKLAKERDRLLSTIRNIVGFEDFLQPRQCADIMGRLPGEGIIVIINIHKDRCDVLALTAGAGDPLHIPLPKFSYQEAERLAKGLREHLLHLGVISRKGEMLDAEDLPAKIDLVEVLSVLWSLVVWPILDTLCISVTSAESKSVAKMPRIWWCPTGPLAFLPIHAAGNYQSTGMPKLCLSDFAISSYIPTVNFLQKSESDSPKEHGTGLLIVSQPNTPKMKSIPSAADEAKVIVKQLERRRIPSTVLHDWCGTVENILKAMEDFPSIHLACHASQDTTNPLKSAIYLHDGPLELSEVMKKNLSNSDFAFLSACQTSTGDKNLPEEVVHLAAGMLAAGYRSVIGTMWSISDKHAPDMAQFFYEGLLDDTAANDMDGTRAAHALHRAIQRFREKLPDSPTYLPVWVPYIHIGV